MPAATCPLPGCTYTTDDTEPVLAAAQLNLHALTHMHASAAPRPTLRCQINVPPPPPPQTLFGPSRLFILELKESYLS